MSVDYGNLPLASHSGAASTSMPAFARSDVNAALVDGAAHYRGSASFLDAEQLQSLDELSMPDPRGTGFVDLAGEVHARNSRARAAAVFINGAGLTLTFGGPGSGKSSLISTQLLHPRRDSVVVLDVKGELYARCGDYMRKHMRVVQHGLFFEPGAGFNPLRAIPGAQDALGTGPEAIRAQTEIANLADDVIVPTLDQPFWVNGERAIFKALAGYVHGAPLVQDKKLALEQPWLVRRRTMAEVPRLLHLPLAQRKLLIEQGLMRSRAEVRDGACEWGALMQAREAAAAIQSDLLRQLSPWSHPILAYSSQQCSYSFADLRREPTAVFLRVPPAQLEFCKTWLRSYFGTAMRHLTHHTKGCGVTIYLDEAALLGAMPSMDNIIGAIRGYRIRLNCAYQALGQLKRAYPDSWETWLSTAMSKSYFGINDVDTAEWISRSIGDTTIAVPSFQVGSALTRGDVSSTSHTIGKNRSRGGSANSGVSVSYNEPQIPGGSSGQGGPVPTITTTYTSGGGDNWSDAQIDQTTSTNSGSTANTQSDATQWTFERRRLMDATEVMHLPDGMQIIQTPKGPILARMARFFENPTLLARATPLSADALPEPSYNLPSRQNGA